MLAGLMSPVGLKTHKRRNQTVSALLLLGFPLLLILLVYAMMMMALAVGVMPFSPEAITALNSGAEPLPVFAAEAAQSMPRVIPFAIIGAGVWYLVAYFSHQKLIDMATGAKPISRKQEPELYNMVENLCISRGMATPHIRIIETDALNAYASGLKEGQYSVTFTRGLLESLDREEVEAVAAHELSHIRHQDVRMMVIAIIFAGIISFVGELMWRSLIYGRLGGRGGGRKGAGAAIFVAFAIAAIAYILSILIRFSISRKREYMADAGAVELTKNADAMIRALERIRDGHTSIKAPDEVRGMFLENKPKSSFMGLFATHPPIESRIYALKEYAGGQEGLPSGPPFKTPAERPGASQPEEPVSGFWKVPEPDYTLPDGYDPWAKPSDKQISDARSSDSKPATDQPHQEKPTFGRKPGPWG